MDSIYYNSHFVRKHRQILQQPLAPELALLLHAVGLEFNVGQLQKVVHTQLLMHQRFGCGVQLIEQCLRKG